MASYQIVDCVCLLQRGKSYYFLFCHLLMQSPEQLLVCGFLKHLLLNIVSTEVSKSKRVLEIF